MAEFTVPPAMVEAAARSLCESHAQRNLPDWVKGAASPWDSPPVPPGAVAAWREGFRAQAREALAAALSVCEVHEQEGLRLDWVDGHGGQSEEWENNRSGWGRNAVRLHQRSAATNPDYPARASLIRRLVITTPAEEADHDA